MVREAKIEDLQAILGLWQQMSKLHEDYDNSFKLKENAVDLFQMYAETVINSEGKLSIVYCDEEVVGYLFAEIIDQPPVYIDDKIGLISEISVGKDFRRKGYGDKLVKYAEDWFSKQDINIIDCQVAVQNPISTKFWLKKGYIGHSLMSRKNIPT